MKNPSSRMHKNSWILVPASFLFAFVLMLLPMPEWTAWLRPAWVLMVLLYWIVMLPNRFGIATAWIVGCLLDIVNGTLLGEHALAMTIAAFIAVRIQIRFRLFPWMQQGFAVLLIVFAYQLVLFCVEGFTGQPPMRWLYWLSSVTSMLFWPWIYSVLRHCQRRLGPLQLSPR
ncbi:MAG: rod shape-determining protein MreD [Gammaproteobacteria bacterium]|nr:rod shape-determining protein MreD [Gammaproteobacteria bacterium]